LSKVAICWRSCRPRREHRSNDRRYVITVGEQSLDAPVERQATHRARQQAERLQHTTNMVRQSRCHADELDARPE
jgi:hypothetical protein